MHYRSAKVNQVICYNSTKGGMKCEDHYGWMINSFKFRYKKITCIVLVILFSPDEPKEKYALVQLDFLNTANYYPHLLVSANARGIMLSTGELRMFFGIRYAENLGDILQQFTELLGLHVPEAVAAWSNPMNLVFTNELEEI